MWYIFPVYSFFILQSLIHLGEDIFLITLFPNSFILCSLTFRSSVLSAVNERHSPSPWRQIVKLETCIWRKMQAKVVRHYTNSSLSVCLRSMWEALYLFKALHEEKSISIKLTRVWCHSLSSASHSFLNPHHEHWRVRDRDRKVRPKQRRGWRMTQYGAALWLVIIDLSSPCSTAPILCVVSTLPVRENSKTTPAIHQLISIREWGTRSARVNRKTPVRGDTSGGR